METIVVKSLDELDKTASLLCKLLSSRHVVTLSGDLGSGKTTLVQAICKHLQVVDEVISPTFSLINTYLTRDSGMIHHIDLYRLRSLEEALEIGIQEYLESGDIIFIEWPDLILDILPEDYLQIEMIHMPDQQRKIVIL